MPPQLVVNLPNDSRAPTIWPLTQPQAENENDCEITTSKHHPKEGDRLQNKKLNGKSKVVKSKSTTNHQAIAVSQAANLFEINTPPPPAADTPDAEKNDLSAENLRNW